MLYEPLMYAIVFGVFGLIFGSAINAAVWRLHVGKSWAKGRSQCSDCGHTLHAKDLVPVLSWLVLGGKCRYCRKPIQDHPVVELVTAALFGLSAYVLAPGSAWDWVYLIWWLAILVLLIVLAVYDARWMILPNKIMWPLAILAAALTLALAVHHESAAGLVGPAMAALFAGGGFWLIVVLTKGRGMGEGDIKLAFVMGILLGLKGTALAMLIAFNAAALVALVLMAMRRRGRKDQIPFGPFLVLGTIISFLFAQPIVDWYLRMNGLS